MATLHAADPAALDNQLTDVAKRAYQTSQEAWTAKNMDDAQTVAKDTGEVTKAANGINGAASGQAGKIQDLLRTIG